jgi:hypothetical protein
MINPKNFTYDAISYAVIIVVTLIIGHKGLTDPDIAWHLAGGLWMLENGRILFADPLASTSVHWHAYSWLVELIFAIIYKYGGFQALQYLQTLLIVVSVIALYVSIQVINKSYFKDKTTQNHISELLGILVLLLFASPIFQLRPQLISLVFFAFLIVCAETKRLRPVYIVPLCILWANIHVYWIFVPIVVFLYRVAFIRSYGSLSDLRSGLWVLLLSLLAPLINPYGFQIYKTLIQYSFEHKIAYSIISEFQSINLSLGYVAVLFLISIFCILINIRKIILANKQPLLVLFLFFAFIATLRIKFIPIYGFISSILLLQFVFPKVISWINTLIIINPTYANKSSKVRFFSTYILLAVLLIAFSFLCFHFFDNKPPLTIRHKEMFEVAEGLVNDRKFADMSSVNLFNHLNDGGWLALALFVNRAIGESESKFKTSIDGRTLVMGEKRLDEFDTIINLKPNWDEVLQSWDVDLAFLPAGLAINEVLRNDTSWVVYKEFKHWVIYTRRGVVL